LKEDSNARFGQVADSFPSSSALSLGNDYYITNNISGFNMFAHVVRRVGNWPCSPGSIRVSYTAGWTADELNGNVSDLDLDASDIKMATLLAIASRYNEALSIAPTQGAAGSTGSVERFRIDDYEIQYGSTTAESSFDQNVSLPTNSRTLLSQYRRVNVL